LSLFAQTVEPVSHPTCRAALKTHPDRVPSDSPERDARTKKFQAVNDAYYTLSDPSRRRDYDEARRYHNFQSSSDADTGIPKSTFGSNFPWSAFGFGAGTSGSKKDGDEQKFSEEQFGDVFEDMLREEGMAEGQEAKPTGKFWSVVGGLSGGAMGFIVANFPGALAGAVAGNRLGAVRDVKGKSVYTGESNMGWTLIVNLLTTTVFQELPQDDKSRLLSQLAARVLTSAVGIS